MRYDAELARRVLGPNDRRNARIKIVAALANVAIEIIFFGLSRFLP